MWVRRESEEGGAGDPETFPPVYLTAIYCREPPRQQLGARCFMVRRLPLSSFHPQLCPKVARATLCVRTRHREHKPEPPPHLSPPAGQLKGTDLASPSYGSAPGRLSGHGSLLLPAPPQVQEEEEETFGAQRYTCCSAPSEGL